jgi:hypothetical protein
MWRLVRKKEKGHWLRAYVPILDGEFQKGQLIEVDAVGLGCCLIRTDVFKHVPRPWFEWTLGRVGIKLGVSEDFDFCERVKAKGYHVIVDTGLIVKHEITMKASESGRMEFAEI